MNNSSTQSNQSERSYPGTVLRLNSKDLFTEGNVIEIVHHEVVYRLQLTSTGKLILTK